MVNAHSGALQNSHVYYVFIKKNTFSGKNMYLTQIVYSNVKKLCFHAVNQGKINNLKSMHVVSFKYFTLAYYVPDIAVVQITFSFFSNRLLYELYDAIM